MCNIIWVNKARSIIWTSFKKGRIQMEFDASKFVWIHRETEQKIYGFIQTNSSGCGLRHTSLEANDNNNFVYVLYMVHADVTIRCIKFIISFTPSSKSTHSNNHVKKVAFVRLGDHMKYFLIRPDMCM